MKNTYFAILLILSSTTFAQNDSTQINLLNEQIKLLNTRLMLLENVQINTVKQSFSDYSTIIVNGKTLIDQMNQTGNELYNRIQDAIKFNKLVQINNPSSDILGFSFSEAILQMAEKHFLYKLKDTTERRRFQTILKNVMASPITQTVLAINPYLNSIYGIVSVASNFISTKVIPAGTFKKDQQVSEVAFNQKDIQSFVDTIKPFIEFYDKLNSENLKFDVNINQLNSRITIFKESINKEFDNFYAVNKFETNIKLDASSTPKTQIDSAKLQKLKKSATQVIEYVPYADEINAIYQEFNKINNDYYNAVLQILDLRNQLPLPTNAKNNKTAVDNVKKELTQQDRILKDYEKQMKLILEMQSSIKAMQVN